MNFLALPPPINSRRFALSPAGLCSQVISRILPLMSPAEITSAAACCTALSAADTKTSVLSLFLSFGSDSARSTTIATRHSVSSWAAAGRESAIFIGISNQYERREGNCASGEASSDTVGQFVRWPSCRIIGALLEGL